MKNIWDELPKSLTLAPYNMLLHCIPLEQKGLAGMCWAIEFQTGHKPSGPDILFLNLWLICWIFFFLVKQKGICNFFFGLMGTIAFISCTCLNCVLRVPGCRAHRFTWSCRYCMVMGYVSFLVSISTNFCEAEELIWMVALHHVPCWLVHAVQLLNLLLIQLADTFVSPTSLENIIMKCNYHIKFGHQPIFIA